MRATGYNVVGMKLAKLNSRNRHSGPKPKPQPAQEIKLNLGSGPTKMPGFISVDNIPFPSVDMIADLRDKWPWPDNSVSEVHCSHTLEHFDAMERVHFVNELFRVMKPGAKATVITPHWASCRAYGDPTHKWPPMAEFAFFYWKKEWRMAQAPHTDITHNPRGFTCNFDVTWGYSLEPGVAARNQEYQQYAIQYLKESAQDTIATLIKPA